MQVAVVGAGPVGLALACYLRRLDMTVRVFEKRAGASEHSKAIGLQHRVSELLAILGVADRFIARSGSPTSVNLYEGHRRILQLRFPTPHGISGRGAFLPRPLLLPQSDTEKLLAELLAELGTRVEWETELVEHRQDPSGVDCVVRRDGRRETVRAQWLVSCEGAHSSVRKQSGIDFEGKSYPLAFLMADVVMTPEVSHLESHVWLHPQGSVALLPLPPGNTWRLFIEVPAVEASTQQADLARVQRIVWERASPLSSTAIDDLLWLSDFRIHARMVGHMRAGRVFLAGDAAHIHSPTGGQGITTGIHDAINLAWKLGRMAHGAPDALLDTYEEERRPHAAEVLRETDRTTSVLLAPRFPWRYVRDYLVLPLLRMGSLQKRMFGKFSQLHVSYRPSSLSQPHAKRRPRGVRLLPGDRAPDVAFLSAATGSMLTVFELLSELRPLVLLRTAPRAEDALVQLCARLGLRAFAIAVSQGADLRSHALTDLYADFARLYGVSPEFLWLLRPDGHVGLYLPRIERHALEQYLRLICAPAAVDLAFRSDAQ